MFRLLVIRKSDGHQVIKTDDTNEKKIKADYVHYNKVFDPKKYKVTLEEVK